MFVIDVIRSDWLVIYRIFDLKKKNLSSNHFCHRSVELGLGNDQIPKVPAEYPLQSLCQALTKTAYRYPANLFLANCFDV